MSRCMTDVQRIVSFGGDRYVGTEEGKVFLDLCLFVVPVVCSTLLKLMRKEQKGVSKQQRGQRHRPVGTRRWWW